MVTLLLLYLSGAIPPAESWTASSHTRIRPVDALTEQVVVDAVRRSPTVACLLEQIERTNVIVYLSARPGLRVRGQLTFIGYGDPMTYVRVSIDPRQAVRDRAATLAHELVHVLEIAGADRPIRSDGDLLSWYGRAAAVSRRGEVQIETELARAIEMRVRSETGSAPTRPQQ